MQLIESWLSFWSCLRIYVVGDFTQLVMAFGFSIDISPLHKSLKIVKVKPLTTHIEGYLFNDRKFHMYLFSQTSLVDVFSTFLPFFFLTILFLDGESRTKKAKLLRVSLSSFYALSSGWFIDR